MSIITQNEYARLSPSDICSIKSMPSNLLKKESLYEETINHLESERENLYTTVIDLRQLIKRITIQQDQEAVRKHKIQLEYVGKIKSLERALKVSEQCSGHLGNMRDFWKDYIN